MSNNTQPQHTAGPWSVLTGKERSLPGLVNDSEIRGGSRGYNVVVRLGKLYTDEQKADAALIAAAPEMLDALREAHYWCSQEADDQECQPSQEMLENRVEVLEAAIAKAQ